MRSTYTTTYSWALLKIRVVLFESKFSHLVNCKLASSWEWVLRRDDNHRSNNWETKVAIQRYRVTKQSESFFQFREHLESEGESYKFCHLKFTDFIWFLTKYSSCRHAASCKKQLFRLWNYQLNTSTGIKFEDVERIRSVTDLNSYSSHLLK